jgi:hypothetical protein
LLDLQNIILALGTGVARHGRSKPTALDRLAAETIRVGNFLGMLYQPNRLSGVGCIWVRIFFALAYQLESGSVKLYGNATHGKQPDIIRGYHRAH